MSRRSRASAGALETLANRAAALQEDARELGNEILKAAPIKRGYFGRARTIEARLWLLAALLRREADRARRRGDA